MSKKVILNSRKNSVGNKTDIPYQELFELYIKDCKLRNISDITIQGYAFANKYFLDKVGNVLCSEVTQELIDDYKISLVNRCKPETVNSYIFKVSPIVKFGYKKGYIAEDIEFNHMIEQDRLKDIYTDAELEKLLKTPKTDSFTEYRSWIIINLLLGTGIRSKELRELKIKDVDFENRVLNLSHTKNKKIRVIPLHPKLTKLLSEYIEVRNGTPSEILFCNQFGGIMATTTLQQSITKYNKDRGVNKSSIHLFRHTFITLAIKNGINLLLLKQITGHKDLKMLNRYYNANMSDMVDIANSFNPLEKFNAKKKISLSK